MEKKQDSKFKKFVKKHKVAISLVGGTVIGLAAGSFIYKTKKVYITKEIIREITPEWVKEWENHCNTNNLLYQNGLPIFANEEQTKIYRDAFAPEADIQSFIESGFEIVERT